MRPRLFPLLLVLGLSLSLLVSLVSLGSGDPPGRTFAVSHCNWQTGTGCPAPPTRCSLFGGAQDPSCTPGALNPAVRQGTIARTICSTGFISGIRPTGSYMAPLQLASMRAYGLGTDRSAYAFDHLVPLSLGGAPSDIRNLWPQSRHSPSFSIRKDRLERSLHTGVCRGKVPLAKAQRRILDWAKFVSTKGGGGPRDTVVPSPVRPPVLQAGNCFTAPNACAYPDATNTGPSGALTPADGSTSPTPGQTLENLDITGQVRISADNVTIKNSRITGTQVGENASIVEINDGDNVKIVDTEIRGKGEGEETAEAAVRGNALLERDHFYHTATSASSTTRCRCAIPTCTSTSMHSGRPRRERLRLLAGDHGRTLDAVQRDRADRDSDRRHDLQRQQGQPVHGQELAPRWRRRGARATGQRQLPGAETIITGNHIARCLGDEYTANNGHWYCDGGPDSSGYFPNGGSYYVGCCFGGARRLGEQRLGRQPGADPAAVSYVA